jgi:hypothetical protein
VPKQSENEEDEIATPALGGLAMTFGRFVTAVNRSLAHKTNDAYFCK